MRSLREIQEADSFYCKTAGKLVALDQRLVDCAIENHCPYPENCDLRVERLIKQSFKLIYHRDPYDKFDTD